MYGSGRIELGKFKDCCACTGFGCSCAGLGGVAVPEGCRLGQGDAPVLPVQGLHPCFQVILYYLGRSMYSSGKMELGRF